MRGAIKVVAATRPKMDFRIPASACIQAPLHEVSVDLDRRVLAATLDYIHALQAQCGEHDVRCFGIVLGSTAYFTLLEYIYDPAIGPGRSHRGPHRLAELPSGERLFLDPLRDGGDPVPLFEEDEARLLFVLRREPRREPCQRAAASGPEQACTPRQTSNGLDACRACKTAWGIP